MKFIQDFLSWAALLPPLAKMLVSLIIVAAGAVILVVLWSQPGVAKDHEANLWPANKSMDGLRARLDLLSRENARFLVEVAAADQYGLYITEVGKRLQISRTEADARSKQLEAQGLIEIHSLTDLNFRLNKDLRELIAPDPLTYLQTYLKQQPVKPAFVTP